jgi:hypothetical protein
MKGTLIKHNGAWMHVMTDPTRGKTKKGHERKRGVLTCKVMMLTDDNVIGCRVGSVKTCTEYGLQLCLKRWLTSS